MKFITLAFMKKIAFRVFLVVVGCMPASWIYAQMCSLERTCEITTTWLTYPETDSSKSHSVILDQDVSCGPWEETCSRTPRPDDSGGGSATTNPEPPPQPEPPSTPPPPEPDFRAQRCADCEQICRVESAQLREAALYAAYELGVQRCTEGVLPNGQEITMKGTTMRECGTKHCTKLKVFNASGVVVNQCEEYERPERFYCEVTYYPRDYQCVKSWVEGMPGETVNRTFNVDISLGKYIPFLVTPGIESGWAWNPTNGLRQDTVNKANAYQDGCIFGGRNWEGQGKSPCTVECTGL